MSKKEIIAKITKYLHKANRLKSTKLKLEKMNELLEILHVLSIHVTENHEGFSNNASHHPEELTQEIVEQYIELCQIHKLKFQMDALFARAEHEIKEYEKHPEQLTQNQFDSLLQRIYGVLDIDPGHPEARGMIDLLTKTYPEYAENSGLINVYIDLAPYQRSDTTIDIECPLPHVTEDEQLRSLYKSYQIDSNDTEQETKDPPCRLRFSLKQFEAFTTFHEELHTKSNYHIFVNNRSMEEKAFAAWFHCYKRYLKAQKPQYCYGASPLTLNFFGCHQLSMPDVKKYIEQCWFYYGTLDQESGLFLVDKNQIADQIRRHLETCGFCPAFSQEKCDVGLGVLPNVINSEYDSRWNYLYSNGNRIGVVPSGGDIAIALHPLETEKIEAATLLEVGSTPYIDKVLRYLESHDRSDLDETRAKGISHCLSCGAPYKIHTMICSKCKFELGKYVAEEEIEKILADLKEIKPIEMPSPKKQQAPASNDAAGSSEKNKAPVSFDELWSDPQVQEILSIQSESQITPQPEAPSEKPRDSNEPLTPVLREELLTAPESPTQSPVPAPSRPISSGRFDLHGKLKSLISKKYRERKAIEYAFSEPQDLTLSSEGDPTSPRNVIVSAEITQESSTAEDTPPPQKARALELPSPQTQQVDIELLNAVKKLKPRQKSELSKRGVVRVIYHATIDKEICPLCDYLDDMVMDPDAPATDIFSPPLFSGCTCSREYVLKTEKPSNWPEVTFRFPPKELLEYLEKPTQ